MRGYAHESAGVLDKAIADYTCAVRIKPDFAEAFLARASAHESRGERGKAIADYTKVIRLKPDSVEAYFFRGNAYSENWGVHKGAFESTKTRLMKAGMQPDWPEAGWVRKRHFTKRFRTTRQPSGSGRTSPQRMSFGAHYLPITANLTRRFRT